MQPVEDRANSDGDGEVDVSTFSGLSDKRGSATNFAALLDNSDDVRRVHTKKRPQPGSSEFFLR